MKLGSVTLTLALSLEGEGNQGAGGLPRRLRLLAISLMGGTSVSWRAIHDALFLAALHAVSLLDSLFPVVRSLMKIGNSNNANGFGAYLIDQTVGEAVCQTPACVL